MSMLSQRLSLRVAQKQILTPGLVQMVTVLQLNRLELREMINQEISQNPVLDESQDGMDELTPEEVQAVLEAERVSDPSDKALLEALAGPAETVEAEDSMPVDADLPVEVKPATDPFDEIDFDTSFQDYLDPGYKSPASESVDKPSWETFVSSPVTLPDHLQSQLSLVVLPDGVRDAADTIIGNLDENGYLPIGLEEVAASGIHPMADVEAALEAVQALDPAGVGARDVRECLLLQIASRNGRGGVAWQIIADHMRLLESRQWKELGKSLNRPIEHIQIAVEVIKHLDPRPGLRYSGPPARAIEPDVYK